MSLFVDVDYFACFRCNREDICVKGGNITNENAEKWRAFLWDTRRLGRKFKLAALLRGTQCCYRASAGDVADKVYLGFSTLSHLERLYSELEEPETAKQFNLALWRMAGCGTDTKVGMGLVKTA